MLTDDSTSAQLEKNPTTKARQIPRNAEFICVVVAGFGDPGHSGPTPRLERESSIPAIAEATLAPEETFIISNCRARLRFSSLIGPVCGNLLEKEEIHGPL
jgi:hypothetical protein